jgi:uncharacterized protein YjbI with pentapeptide repeats
VSREIHKFRLANRPSNAILSGAQLINAKLSGADLSRTNPFEAELIGAYLARTNLMSTGP